MNFYKFIKFKRYFLNSLKVDVALRCGRGRDNRDCSFQLGGDRAAIPRLELNFYSVPTPPSVLRQTASPRPQC
jgi:hypothetical protein